LANGILGAALPDEVSKKIREDKAVKELAVRVNELLFSEDDPPGKAFRYFILQVRVWRRSRDKILYCIGRLFTPNAADLATMSLPPFLSFVYYLIRPLRLAKTYLLRH